MTGFRDVYKNINSYLLLYKEVNLVILSFNKKSLLSEKKKIIKIRISRSYVIWLMFQGILSKKIIFCSKIGNSWIPLTLNGCLYFIHLLPLLNFWNGLVHLLYPIYVQCINKVLMYLIFDFNTACRFIVFSIFSIFFFFNFSDYKSKIFVICQ